MEIIKCNRVYSVIIVNITPYSNIYSSPLAKFRTQHKINHYYMLHQMHQQRLYNQQQFFYRCKQLMHHQQQQAILMFVKHQYILLHKKQEIEHHIFYHHRWLNLIFFPLGELCNTKYHYSWNCTRTSIIYFCFFTTHIFYTI